jgi:anti-anti-sigma regulatory factor
MVLRIDLEQRDDETVLLLIGSITSPDVQQLKALMAGVRNRVVLDLAQVQRVGLDAAHFLAAAERSGTELRRVPRYVREWILLESSRVAQLQEAARRN